MMLHKNWSVLFLWLHNPTQA